MKLKDINSRFEERTRNHWAMMEKVNGVSPSDQVHTQDTLIFEMLDNQMKEIDK